MLRQINILLLLTAVHARRPGHMVPDHDAIILKPSGGSQDGATQLWQHSSSGRPVTVPLCNASEVTGGPCGRAGPEVRGAAAADWLARANAVARTLLPEFPEAAALGLYDAATALWHTTPGSTDQLGWQNGYTLKTLANFAGCARDAGRFPETQAAVLAALDRTFTALAWNAGRVRGDDKYDDLNFWTSTWRVAYHYSGNGTYAAAATNLFYNYVLNNTSWRTATPAADAIWRGTGPGVPCGGGALWDKASGYINAISNEWLLYNLADVGLLDGQVAQGDANAWAHEVWDWLSASPMLNDQHLFNDGLSPMPAVAGVTCTNNHQQVWTYNNGVILGALAELAEVAPTLEKREGLLSAASAIARAAATTLVAEATAGNATVAVLAETACQATRDCCGNNEVFKGMFAQHLARLVRAAEAATGPTADTQFFRQFLRDSAASLWQHANANAADAAKPAWFGLLWQGPVPADNGNFYQTTATQSIALDLLTQTACL